MYGLIAACFFYTFICASLAELSSALPSSANVYHWASVTPGKKLGRILSFYAGWWNALGWIFGCANCALFGANSIIAMYSVYHPDYVPQRWQVFVCFVVIAWGDLCLLLFGQRILAKSFTIGGVLLLSIFVVTTLVCAIMPSQTGAGYASNAFVWTTFQNLTGWSSSGLVFVMGILNGAYAIGTPDAVCHLCEEIPNPRRNIPYGIVAQVSVGAITTFAFYLSVVSPTSVPRLNSNVPTAQITNTQTPQLYAVTDLNAVFETRLTALPLAGMFLQATRSNAGTFALLFLFLIDQLVNLPGAYITAGRMLWTLARDDAVPFSNYVRKVDGRWRTPFVAQCVVGVCVTILGAIWVGNVTAYAAFVGSFVILTTWSYTAAILPHLLTGRKNVLPGPFWMPTWVAYSVSGLACAYMLVFDVIYMFPFVYPVDALTMNYASLMSGGLTILLTVWYLWKRTRGYEGPRVVLNGRDDVIKGLVGLSKEEEEEIRRRSARGSVG